MSSDKLALINLYLQAGYVFLTLVIAFTAIWAIWANGKQSRKALFNQHKPVIVPTSRSELDLVNIALQNKGTGVALNTWGVLNSANTKQLYRFKYTYFLVPDKLEAIE